MSDIYYDTYNEGEAPEETSATERVIRLILRTATITVLVVIFGVLFYRMWEMREPSGVGEFLWTEEMLEKYESVADKETVVREEYLADNFQFERENFTAVTVTKEAPKKEDYETLILTPEEYYESVGFRVFTNVTGSYTVTDDEGAEETVKCTGWYESVGSPVEHDLRVSDVYFVPSLNVVQLTFRYKEDCLEKLGGIIWSDGSDFQVYLEDDLGNTYTDYRYKKNERGVYCYVTMVFEGVAFDGVGKMDLIAKYQTAEEDGELSMYVYDKALPLSIEEVKVKKDSAEKLNVYKR